MSLLGLLALLAGPGCGTSAKGIQDCRDIEQARCRAATACGIVAHEADCEIYYRDHCLHGLPITPPQPAAINDCVATITTLGACVQAEGRDALLVNCMGDVQADNATSACEVVQYPERAYACSFLTGTEVAPPPESSAGAGNTDTSSAGQGGQAGSQ